MRKRLEVRKKQPN